MFRRIQHSCQGGSHSARPLPRRLYWLLPWHLFDSHVERLAQILVDGISRGMRTKAELPDLDAYFRPVRAGLAPSLRQMTEWRGTREPVRVEHVRNFVDAVWRTDYGRIPPTSRQKLARAVELCGSVLEKTKVQRNATETTIAMAHAHLLAFSLLGTQIRPQMPEHLEKLSRVRGLPANRVTTLRQTSRSGAWPYRTSCEQNLKTVQGNSFQNSEGHGLG